MNQFKKRCSQFTSEKMDVEIEPVLENNQNKVIISFHDESSAHSKDFNKKGWKRYGKTGTLKEKDKGKQCMVSAWVCQECGK